MTALDPDSGHYLIVVRLIRPRTVRVGALGRLAFAAGDYVYVGSAQRGLAARVARHRRRGDKTLRWHFDYLRAVARWREARILLGARGRECSLAAEVASLAGATVPVPRFGASDCRCAGHLVHFPDGAPELPGLRLR